MEEGRCRQRGVRDMNNAGGEEREERSVERLWAIRVAALERPE